MAQTRIKQVGKMYYPQFRGPMKWKDITVGTTRGGNTVISTLSLDVAKNVIDLYLERLTREDEEITLIKYP